VERRETTDLWCISDYELYARAKRKKRPVTASTT
jgi:hypothetical protein